MILGTLGASLLGNLLSGKKLCKEGKGMYRAGSGDNKCVCKRKKNGLLGRRNV